MTEPTTPEDTLEIPSWLLGTFGPNSDAGTLADSVAQDREKNDAIRMSPDRVIFADSVRVKYGDQLGDVVAAVQSWEAPEGQCEHDRQKDGMTPF